MPEARPRVADRHRCRLLEPARAVSCTDDHVRTPALDAESMEGPVRRFGDHSGGRRHVQLRWPRRASSELMDQRPIRLMRRVGGDLLADHSRQQRLEHRTRLRYAQAWMPSLRFGERGLARLEARIVVLLAAQRRDVFGGPLCARAPGVDVHHPFRAQEPDRGRTLRRVSGTPYLAAAQAQGRSRPYGCESEREV